MRRHIARVQFDPFRFTVDREARTVTKEYDKENRLNEKWFELDGRFLVTPLTSALCSGASCRWCAAVP